MVGKFELLKSSKKHKGRAGILHTAHGSIETPVFMPVGTQATVKGLTPQMVEDTGAQIVLSNTYHLALRPGSDLVEEMGGLHKFMNWSKPILTDSGGYQVFSLSKMRKISDDGVEFRSHIDGSKRMFTPESVIDIQRQLGSDIMMPLDICSPYPCKRNQLEKDWIQTLAWEKRAKAHWEKAPGKQLLFAIVQGGMDNGLRKESAQALIDLDFPGYAVGGVSVGEPLDEMNEITAHTVPLLPEDKPRYLMGVGLPENMQFCIEQGVDMFDCVAPTRLARHGQVFDQEGGRLNIKNAQFQRDQAPIDPSCDCYACQHFTRAYIRHLFIAKEVLAITLMSLHNIRHMVRLVTRIREGILAED
ncbi:tRNA guanosine(34) transglycosylase Tgt [bacterium]|jgi:queuine tRNA-ribosyltransferase|nr:tRNA guanosine(34) transglycosylase Tgt [bacterium]